MNYNTILGDFVEAPKYELSEEDRELTHSVNKIGRLEDRLGQPNGAVLYSEVKDDVETCIRVYIEYGYGPFPKGLKKKFAQHLAYFRANLDSYYEIIKESVFDKEEIYFRSLVERGDFTTFIKKSREQSLQAMTGYAGGVLEDKYTHDSYSGYDSIIHERYLINWDETADVFDYQYSLIPAGNSDHDELRSIIRKLFKTYPFKVDTNYKLPFLDKIAGKKTSLLDKCKTTNLANVWEPGVEFSDHWVATRRVIPIDAGNIRDTGVPDIESLMKLKYLHHQVYAYLETLPFSANCSFSTLNRRLSRLQGGKSLFAHIDFKKFGLTFPRFAYNTVLEEAGLNECKIDQFTLETSEGSINTKRGGVLGWFDSVVSIATIAIILNLAQKEGWSDFDMLQFNDDIEISFDDLEKVEGELRLIKICEELERFDFLLSWRKCYMSEMSIFLEQYVDPTGQWSHQFGKTQLAVKHFAIALTSPYRWETKTRFNLGHFYGYTTALKERIFQKWPEREPGENLKPVELGGFMSYGVNGLNTALEEASWGDLAYFNGIAKYKEPDLADKWVFVDLHSLAERRRKKVLETFHEPIPDPGIIKLDEKPEYTPQHIEAMELMALRDIAPPRPPRPLRHEVDASRTSWDVDPT